MSNQLEQLRKLQAKPVKIKLPLNLEEGEEQIELEIRPITIDNSELFDVSPDIGQEAKIEHSMKLIAASLDVSIEEVKKLKMGILFGILGEIHKINGIGKQNNQSRGMNRIKQLQDKVKSQQVTKKK